MNSNHWVLSIRKVKNTVDHIITQDVEGYSELSLKAYVDEMRSLGYEVLISGGIN